MLKRTTARLPLPAGPATGADEQATHPDQSRRRKLVRLYLLATILLSLMFSLYIWQYTKMVEVRLQIRTLIGRCESLETNNAVLRAEISKLTALERIEKVARQDLGMVDPTRLRYLPVPGPTAGQVARAP